MIKTIIFSKDRPLQLDLTIKSLLHNLKQSTENVVIYKASDANYDYAYQMIKENYLHYVKFIKESELFSQIYKECHTSLPYVNFLTDDCIVYKKVILDKGFENILSDPAVCCFSLRLGSNIKYRFHNQSKFYENIPAFQKLDEFLVFNRLSIPPGGYFGYPLSVDGHIFKKVDLQELVLKTILYNKHIEEGPQTPNTFEQLLQKFFFDVPATMFCHEHSSVVNSPNNRVQNTHRNSFGTAYNYHQNELLSKYVSGFRIDIKSLDFSNIECPHQEIKLL
jgi:hypothetical protein